MRALEEAHIEATKTMETEHVTPFINMQPDRFIIQGYECNPSKKHLRWTLDEPEDYEFIKAVYDNLYPGGISSACLVSLLLQKTQSSPLLT